MSGIITGMLTAMDISSLTSMLSGLGIDLDDFMSELQKVLGGLGISGFGSFEPSSGTVSFSDIAGDSPAVEMYCSKNPYHKSGVTTRGGKLLVIREPQKWKKGKIVFNLYYIYVKLFSKIFK